VTARLPNDRSRRGVQFALNNSDNSTDAASSWEAMCASQSPNAAAALAERIRSKVEPTAQQGSAFNALKDSLTHANARIQAACPSAVTMKATDRLELMASRLLAMRQAISLVMTPLRKFYATLSDEQKARMDSADTSAPAPTDTSRMAAASGPVGCGEPDDEWPTTQIARRVAPKPEQFQDLEVLRQTSAALGQFVATTCAAGKTQTAPERLDSALKRINVIRYAVTHVSPALDEFYDSLTPAQKARFGSLGK
jgi:hypothetical protein